MPKNLDIYLAIDITLVLIHELLAVIRALRRNRKPAASNPARGSIYGVCDECISTPDELEKYARPRWESNLRPLEY